MYYIYDHYDHCIHILQCWTLNSQLITHYKGESSHGIPVFVTTEHLYS